MLSNAKLHIPYSIALLLSTAPRKTCESLAREMGISGDTVNKYLEQQSPDLFERIAAATKILKRKKLYLLLDDTLITKTYSRCIEGTSDNYSSSDRTIQRSLCSIVAMLTDGKIAIPIDQAIWSAREVDPVNYKTKVVLSQGIIEEVKKHVDIDIVIIDGLYATVEMMQWLNDNNIKFEMRFHSNRKIRVNNQNFKIKECPFFKLNGYRTERTIAGSWHDIKLYFTGIIRWFRNGESTIVFQVSNYKTSAQQHKKIYGYRWNIEKFFRTAKQHLGLNDCQSRKKEKQENHIINVFIAYTVAQHERIKLKCKNVEEAIKSIKKCHIYDSDYAIDRFRAIFE